jgi:hypothetical protein
MTMHWIEVDMELRDSPAEMQRFIEAELQRWGEPLRWAVTDVDVDRQTIHVEAIVTQSKANDQE